MFICCTISLHLSVMLMTHSRVVDNRPVTLWLFATSIQKFY